MIPRDIIDRIYGAAKIEDVVSDYVTLRRRGANLWGNCPFHDEKTPSFSVSPTKGIYKCFGCGKAGNVTKFIMEYEQCSYVDALKQLAKKYHIEIQEREETDEEKQRHSERESLFATNEWANKWFQQQLWETQEGQTVGMAYFVERGLREDTIRKFQLGYSPEKNLLYDAARKAGYADEFLEKTGLCGISQHDGKRYDRFRDRVIFPIFTISGKVVAFAGRILKKKEHTGKYVNSPESAIYSKQKELYGLFQAKQAIAKQQMCYLVEGQMDVISMHQAGVENVVSSGGTALTHRQVVLLHRLTENVTILYDGDSAGIHAALRGIDMFLEEGLNLKVVLLPDGEDPDSFSRKMNASDFQQYLQQNQQDFIRFKTNLLLQDAQNDPIKKSAVVRDIITSISLIPDRISRDVYLHDCAQLLGMPESTLLNELIRIRRERFAKAEQEKQRTQNQNNTSTDNSTSTTNTNNPISDNSLPSIDEMMEAEIEGQNTQANNSPSTASQIPNNQTTTSEPTPNPTPQLTKIDQNIRNLLQLLIRYGHLPLTTDSQGNTYSVSQCVFAELDADNITFENQTYNNILSEYRQHLSEANFDASTYFVQHPNQSISELAIDLISDKYQLSKLYGRQNISENIRVETHMPTDADRLQELVPRLIYELKLTILEERIKFLRTALQHAQENQQDQEMMQILTQIIPLEEAKRQICKFLGNRILA